MIAQSELGKLASPSALSLFAESEKLPSLVAAGAVLAVSAAVFVYSEINASLAKKHKEKIERINVLYDFYLKSVVVPSRGKIHGFPAIFQMVGEKYQSMLFTPEQIKDIGSSMTHGSDIALAGYREAVRAAIKKLQEYYFVRAKGKRIKADDITASVLSYLMHMLESKCLNFLGYDYDIAYLDAICKFINAYASEGNREKSRHFSRLGPVYSYLLKAKQKLEKHREVLSLQDTVAELKDSCVDHSDKLIRMLVKMVVKDADTDLADTVAHEELQAGILRQTYILSEVRGIPIRKDQEIAIPESIFKEWIKNLSEYYLRSLSIDAGEDETSVAPNSFFSLLERAKQALGQKSAGRAKERAEIKQALERIRHVFQESGNFISTRYNAENKKFEEVTEPAELIERSQIMARIARLTHEIISLQYLCTHLLKSIQLLGDIYVRNPAHFSQIFQVVERLCTLIKDEVKLTKAAFTKLQQDNQNNMQLQEKEDFPNQIKDLLDAVRTEIKELGEQVKECRQLAIKEIPEQVMGKVKYEMLEIATNISKIYFPDVPPPESIDEQSTPVVSPLVSDEKPPVRALPETPSKSTPPLVEIKASGATPIVAVPLDEALTQAVTNLQGQITVLAQESVAEAANYKKVYEALLLLKNRFLMQQGEQRPDQVSKAGKVGDLVFALTQQTLNFIKQPKAERLAKSAAFFADVQAQLHSPENSLFIDRHSNDASRFVYEHLCGQSIFRTRTRRHLADFEQACHDAAALTNT